MRLQPVYFSSAALLSFILSGCSLALDLDALNKGTGDADADVVPVDTDTGPCTSDDQCDDGHDCTEDTCGNSGTCVHIPDNDLCGFLEMCDLEDGCVPTGKDCLVDSHCNDNIDCTVDACVLWRCKNTPDDALCNDGQVPCIVERLCDTTAGCIGGQEMICDQTDLGPCEIAVCDPELGECTPILKPGADDDNDGYLDVTCGGDDCVDMNDKMHPGAVETCNFLDDDCDGLTDIAGSIGPVVVGSASDIVSTDVAFNGVRHAVVWQQGKGDSAAVYARTLGTGECVTDVTCTAENGSLPASPPIDLTALASPGRAGQLPAIVAGGETFFAVWVDAEGGQNPGVMLIGIQPNETSSPDLWDAAAPLSAFDAQRILSVGIAWDPGTSQWLAAWAAQFSDSTAAIELIDANGFANAIPPFRGQLVLGNINDLSLASLGSDDCLVAYTFEDAMTDDAEVLEARLFKSEGAWDYLSAPLAISIATDGVADPSIQPVIARTSDSTWVTAFADIRVSTGTLDPEAESDIRSAKSGVPGEITVLYQDTAFDQSNPSLVYNGENFGLMYLQRGNDVQTLDFRVFDTSLSPIPHQGGRLVRTESGALRPGRMMLAGAAYATTWVEASDPGDDVLQFAAFTGCVPPG
ncbi:MAG: putative metal-binding motif-containing protein [Myxococcota bacterium]|nr:putative metal-binding motif-containing protein [Myxococcota bacterium]